LALPIHYRVNSSSHAFLCIAYEKIKFFFILSLMQVPLAWTVVGSLVITRMKMESTWSLIDIHLQWSESNAASLVGPKAVQDFSYFPVDNRKDWYNKDVRERGTIPRKGDFPLRQLWREPYLPQVSDLTRTCAVVHSRDRQPNLGWGRGGDYADADTKGETIPRVPCSQWESFSRARGLLPPPPPTTLEFFLRHL
jgi:hypothetical protein